MVSLPPTLLTDLDEYCDQEADQPSRQDAIRRILTQTLSASKKKR
jgi:metal-responsive CopG/Arc/MetJ family transcriptional regulator